MTTSPGHDSEMDPPQRTERAGPVESRTAPVSRVAGVLALQRQAGNRAVTALLAREATRDAPPAKAPAKAAPYRVKIPDIGTIAVDSFSWRGPGRGFGGHGAGGGESTELRLSSVMGPHSAALAHATAAGTRLGTVVLEASKDGKVYMRVTLHDAMLSSYQIGGDDGSGSPPESWTLSASKIDREYIEQSKTESDPASPPG